MVSSYIQMRNMVSPIWYNVQGQVHGKYVNFMLLLVPPRSLYIATHPPHWRTHTEVSNGPLEVWPWFTHQWQNHACSWFWLNWVLKVSGLKYQIKEVLSWQRSSINMMRGVLLLLLKILKQIQVKNIMLLDVPEEEEAKRLKSVLFKAAAWKVVICEPCTAAPQLGSPSSQNSQTMTNLPC